MGINSFRMLAVPYTILKFLMNPHSGLYPSSTHNSRVVLPMNIKIQWKAQKILKQSKSTLRNVLESVTSTFYEIITSSMNTLQQIQD